jgi:hypothetical protein
LAEAFRHPPATARPWVYWWWITGNVTEASIVRDLDAMQKNGIGGLLLFDARGYHEDHTPPPPPRTEFMSPQWRKMVQFALTEAHRRGIEVSINLSSCAGALRGPWNVSDDAPKKLVWASQEVQGPSRFVGLAPGKDWGRCWEVALVAVRMESSSQPPPKGSERKTPSPQLISPERVDKAASPGPSSKGRPTDQPSAIEVIDLSAKLDAQGHLAWDVPEGQWTLLRFACVTMEGHDNDVDILSPAAVAAHFERMGRTLLADAGPAAKALTHFYSVSWEGAAPTWTLGFDEYFQRLRGYAIRPYLPVLAGVTVKNREVSERFLRDYHKTLADCFMDHCYGTLRELCHRQGLKWHSESGGPWDRKLPSFEHADQLAFLGRNDMPQGEFWHLGRSFNRPPAMAAHIYGLPLAAAEAFTHMRPHWSGYPAVLKRDADAAFCDGVNHFIWHTFSASPEEFGKPGIVYFAGTHLNPNVTWWEQAGAFLAYLARCQFLLRQGRCVADVCCYTGDKPYLHWGRGEKWHAKPSLVLGKGYAYDLVNTEVLLKRLTVEDGHLVLPDGMRYRVLVVDLEDESVPPEALRRIAELAKAGATVVLGDRRPARAPGLTDYPACDDVIRRLAGELWGPPGSPAQRQPLGKGKVCCGTGLDEALRAEGILPDFDGPWDYTHRRANDLDIYFVSGKGAADCTFRVQGKEPELWDPVTGRTQDAVCWRDAGHGRTLVPLRLPEGGSTFVVFRRPAGHRHLVTAPPEGVEIVGRTAEGARVQIWKAGRFSLATSQERQTTVEAAALPSPFVLEGPWEVHFAKGWGAPESAVFERLLAWNEHPDPGIKFFSGTATYRKSFTLDASQASGLLRLHLGEVKYVAQVRLNGKALGVVWTDPWTVDLTGSARAGKNDLEIDVVNLWPNRLIGDAGLPESKRLTKTNARRDPAYTGRWSHLRGYAPTDPLLPSGLLGPVRIEFGQQCEVGF